MTDWTTLRYAVVDVEGNGHQPPDLVELAVVPISGGEIGAPRNWLVHPDQPITAFATRIHGITNADLENAPSFAEVKTEVRAALDGTVLVAHNAHVDIEVIRRKFGDWQCPEVFDTLKLARQFRPGEASYKLGALAAAFGLADELPPGLTPHRATYDALVTARLFISLITGMNNEPLSIEELRGEPPEGDDDAEAPSLF